MKWPTLLNLLGGIVLLGSSLPGQYSDYDWAQGLSREYGFDDMAEQIFNNMVSGSDRSATERQQGKLGLAQLKGSQARRADSLEGQLALYDEARHLMQQVISDWPDKTSPEFHKAIFALVDLLEERGERAMLAVTEGRVSPEKADEIRKTANADYGRAEVELEKIISGIGAVDPNDNREKWRVKNRAFYNLCLLKFNKALTQKEGGAARSLGLTEGRDMLEEFILANEMDDEEAMLGALYGYILMGQVCQELGERDEAEGFFTSVLDQVVWENKLHPLVQGLVERCYFRLLSFLNMTQQFDKTLRLGGQMEERFNGLGMDFQTLGRAARVKLAEARLRQGDMNGALAIAADVVEAAGDDGSGRLANQLIAEIIAATPDKTQFSPHIIRSAAKGAMSQGKEKRGEAVRYFQILLQVLDTIPDAEERKHLAAEAWYMLGSCHYFEDRLLESALCFGEGARRFGDVTQDDLGQNLVSQWERRLMDAAQQTGSPEVRKLVEQCREWQLRTGMSNRAPGTILYNKARTEESRALEQEKGGNSAAALVTYEEAAKLYAQSVQAGGPEKERAMIRGARVGLKVAKVHLAEKRPAQAMPLIERAKVEFRNFLAFADDPANKLTDPSQIASRITALAEARYSIAECNRYLQDGAADEAAKKQLCQEALEVLRNFEKDYAAQRSLALFAVYERLQVQLDLGDATAAEADFLVLKDLNPDHQITHRAALAVGKALKPGAETEMEKIVGSAKCWEPESWEKVMAAPGFAAALSRWLHVCDLYRQWLLGTDSERFSDWDAVTFMYWSAGAWEPAGDLLSKALERFANVSNVSADELRKLEHRALVAWVNLAQAAEGADQGDRAGRYWNDAGRVAEDLLKDDRYAKNASLVRLTAMVFGGYITKKGALPYFSPALGRFDKALDLWEKIERSLRATSSGSEGWWEAKFYILHCHLRLRREARQDTQDVRKALDSLKVTMPELGGPRWKPFFEWLDRQL